MADITDIAFRTLCKKAGASLVFTEMIHAEALARKNKTTLQMIKQSKEEKPIGIQIAANNTKTLEKTLPYIRKFDLIDLNCGCPVPKIVNNKLGASLLEQPEKIHELIKFLVKKVNIPITAKIRLGFKKVNVLETTKKIEEAGAHAITIHARLANSRYKTKANWNCIKKVKDKLSIPVIGNGDVFTGKDAKELLKKCDAIMIARAAIGDPLVFKRISYYLKNNKELKITNQEKTKQLNEYIKLAKKFNLNFKRIKQQSMYFTKDFPGSRKLRGQIATTRNPSELNKLLKENKL